MGDSSSASKGPGTIVDGVVTAKSSSGFFPAEESEGPADSAVSALVSPVDKTLSSLSISSMNFPSAFLSASRQSLTSAAVDRAALHVLAKREVVCERVWRFALKRGVSEGMVRSSIARFVPDEELYQIEEYGGHSIWWMVQVSTPVLAFYLDSSSLNSVKDAALQRSKTPKVAGQILVGSPSDLQTVNCRIFICLASSWFGDFRSRYLIKG